MKLYNAHMEDVELDTLIFARSGAHAADIFVTFWTAQHGAPPAAFDIFESKLPRISMLNDLHELLRGETSGVVRFGDGDAGFYLEPM